MWLQKEKTKSDEYQTHFFFSSDVFLRQVMAARSIVANKDVSLVILETKIQSAKTPEEKERFEKEQFELLRVTCDWLHDYINYTNPTSSTVTDNMTFLL